VQNLCLRCVKNFEQHYHSKKAALKLTLMQQIYVIACGGCSRPSIRYLGDRTPGTVVPFDTPHGRTKEGTRRQLVGVTLWQVLATCLNVRTKNLHGIPPEKFEQLTLATGGINVILPALSRQAAAAAAPLLTPPVAAVPPVPAPAGNGPPHLSRKRATDKPTAGEAKETEADVRLMTKHAILAETLNFRGSVEV
jgi:hypothetical protein